MEEKKTLNILTERAKKLHKLGDPKANELEHDIAEYQEWVINGKPEHCPVDLRKWGLETEMPEAEQLQSDQSNPQMDVDHQDLDQFHLGLGETTSLEEDASINQVKAAIDHLKQMMEQGQKVAIDPNGDLVPTEELLEQTEEIWRQKSLQTANYVIQKIDEKLSENPEDALDIFEDALVEPDPLDPHKIVRKAFCEEALKLLENKKIEIDKAMKEEENSEPPGNQTLDIDDPRDIQDLESDLQLYIDQEQLNNSLEQARHNFKTAELDKMIQAREECKILLFRENLPPDQLSEVRELESSINRELERRFNEFIEQGNLAKEEGDLDSARASYELASKIDPDQAHALIASLTQRRQEQLSIETIRDLRIGLSTRDDIQKLEEAVREAELLEAERRLPSDLQNLLLEGRQAFNEDRARFGRITTQKRYGNLRQSKEAVDQLTDEVSKGQKSILDPLSGFQKPREALEEANLFWRQRSEETAQYCLTKIDEFLPGHPDIANNFLSNALVEQDPDDPQKTIPRPYHEDASRLLEEKSTEINIELDKKKSAEVLVDRASEEKDPVESFNLILRARQTFPYLSEIDDLLLNARRTAVNNLQIRMQNDFTNVLANMRLFLFKDARHNIAHANELISLWPEDSLPDELLETKQHGENLLNQIAIEEKNREEFLGSVDLINNYSEEKQTIPQALELLEELNADVRFKEYADLRHINMRMDPYRDIAEQLTAAQEAAREQDWQRVFHLTKDKWDLLGSEKLGNEFKNLFNRAYIELEIKQVHDHLRTEDIAAAQRTVETIKNSGNPEAAKIDERLQKELTIINQAEADTPPMQELFNQAEIASEKRSPTQRLLAMRLFLFVGGESVKPFANWPPYRLSLLTAAARKKAFENGEVLRNKILKSLSSAYLEKEEVEYKPEQIRAWAAQARGLAETGLLHTVEDREVARWLELENGQFEAAAYSAAGEWDKVVGVWSKLDILYPIDKKIRIRLRDAKIRQATSHAGQLLAHGDSHEALQVLQKAQEEPDLRQAWQIILMLADAHASRGEFDEAFRELTIVQGIDECVEQVKEKRASLEREERITHILDSAQTSFENGRVNESLVILITAKKDKKLGRSERIDELIKEIFEKSSLELLHQAGEELNKNTYAGKMSALTALIDLRGIEEILSISPNKSSSLKEIHKLDQQDLTDIAKRLVHNAHGFSPQGMKANDALTSTHLTAQRLKTFAGVIILYSGDLHEEAEQINNARPIVNQRLDKFHALMEHLEESQDDHLWQDALQRGDFKELDNLLAKIKVMEFPGILEIENLEERIRETTAVHKYISGAILDIMKNFCEAEDFSAVREKIADIKVRPPSLPEIQKFSQIQQAEYKAILDFMGDQLQIADIYGDADLLIGWEQVDHVAGQRGVELSIWEDWVQTVESRVSKVAVAYDRTKKHDEYTKLGQKKRDWCEVESAIQDALTITGDEPKNEDGDTVPVFSKKAVEDKEWSNDRHLELGQQSEHALAQINNIDAEIDRLGGFPSNEELSNLIKQKNWSRLEKRLKSGDEIGASISEEEKYLQIYQNQLLIAKKNAEMKNFFQRIREMIGL